MVFDTASYTSETINTQFLADEIKADGLSVRFLNGITRLYGKDYFIYLDQKDSLTFVDIRASRIYKTDISKVLNELDEYRIGQVSGNQLFLLNRETKTLFKYTIEKDFTLRFQKKVDLNKSDKLKGINFVSDVDATQFRCNDSLLFINYLVKKTKNFIDEYALVYFNLNEQNLTPKRIIEYPPNFHKEEIRNRELLFDFLNDSTLVFGFMQHDTVGMYFTKSNRIIRSRINLQSGFRPFDESKHRNLGYTAKYLLINEANHKLFFDPSRRIYMMKRLAKAQKTDTTIVQCYVFTPDFTPVHTFKLNHTVCQAFIYPYEEGFIALTNNLDKAYYYAFKK